mmetsp:Transcript_18326/g.33220  ORF Transcript_18326/g.33220 Transcript_18326/m.33220 type:complete len:98 (+) Transcript_18326:46-339(+)
MFPLSSIGSCFVYPVETSKTPTPETMELFDVNQIANVTDPQVAFPDTLATVSMTKKAKKTASTFPVTKKKQNMIPWPRRLSQAQLAFLFSLRIRRRN